MSSWIPPRTAATITATFVAALLVLSPVDRSAVTAATIEQRQAIVDEMYCIKDSLIVGCSESRFQTMEVHVAGTLVAVELYIGRQAAMTGNIVIEIREGLNDGPLLATSNPVSAADLQVLPQGSWIRFTFDEPAAVRVRDVISIVVPLVTADSDADWAWGGSSMDRPEDLYPAGQAWGCYFGPCVNHSFDHAFATHIDDGTGIDASDAPAEPAPGEPASGEPLTQPDEVKSELTLGMTAAIAGLAAVIGLGAGYWVGRRRSTR
jgi:hypothetical protein